MSVKAVAVINHIYSGNGTNSPNTQPGNFAVQADVAGLDASNPVTITSMVEDVPPSLLATGIHPAMAAQIKADLTGIGYTFGIFDTVQFAQ